MMRRATDVMRAGMLSVAVATATARVSAQADTAAATTGVREFLSVCRRDGGKLWGRSLCGRLVVVDPESGRAVATEKPPAGEFARRGSIWIGTMPAELASVSNTAIVWMDQRWSTVRGPLPADRFDRIGLLAHESFHRIQPELGLNRPDAMNDHLDERDGRYLLQLELRALSTGLVAKGSAARQAVLDGLTFRAERGRRYPGSDTLEAMLEMQEGLAEYTGDRIALSETGLGLDRIQQASHRFEGRASFVRALGYGTGPLLGFSLDRFAPGWRTRLRTAGFSAQLTHAMRFVPPADLAAAVAATSQRYGGTELAQAEDARAIARDRALTDYRKRLIEGPVLVLSANGVSRSFNPNNLVPLKGVGTIYPTGGFAAPWGNLEVSEGGALLAASYADVRVPIPEGFAPHGLEASGAGWKLTLNKGWVIRPGARAGDWEVQKEP